jgi:hypothetical protein
MKIEHTPVLDSIFEELAKEAGEDVEMIKRSFFEGIGRGTNENEK